MLTFDRQALALAAALLAGCSEQAATDTRADAERIPCARGIAPLATTCTVDRAETDRGLVLTLRHPDGAFRRLLVTGDGRGVIAADGAEPAAVVPLDAGGIEVRIAGDRYHLPATVQPAAR